MCASLTNSLWCIVCSDALPFECVYSLNDRRAPANLVSAAPLACVIAGTETWALGPMEMNFDSALYLLPSSDG